MNVYRKRSNAFLSKELDPAFARRASIIARNLELIKNGHLLEIGCGRGYYEGFLSYVYPSLRITAIDQNTTYLTTAKQYTQSKRVTFEVGDALHLKYKRNSFNGILASEVLEHLSDDAKALEEMYRVVKPGGIVMITVPNASYPLLWDPLNYVLERFAGSHIPKDIWWLAGIWADHVRLYTKQQLVTVCQRAGFTIESIYFSTHYCIPFSHFLLYGIGKNIVESGLLPDFYRFNQLAKPSSFFRLVKSMLYLRDHLNNDSQSEYQSTVNIILKLRKA